MNLIAANGLAAVSDFILIHKTERLVKDERELLLNVLFHLREIDRRRLYSSLGYKSLFDFTVSHLGYPEDQAYRRISAMRLMQELPEIEEQIGEGVISLTHIGLAQTLFRQEKKLDNEMTHDEKISVLKQIANKPVREAERITLSLSSAPELSKPDRVHAIAENVIEMKFTASIHLREKVELLKGRLAHKHPDISLGELFEQLCDLGLSAWDKSSIAAGSEILGRSQILSHADNMSNLGDSEVVAVRCANGVKNVDAATTSKYAVPAENVNLTEHANAIRSAKLSKTAAPQNTLRKKERRPKRPSQAQVVRGLFEKAENQCENCGSSYALEVDHVMPRAKGGTSDAENLRVLCRSCNQRSAIQEFGLRKMETYLDRH